jgi:hypothetical protein
VHEAVLAFQTTTGEAEERLMAQLEAWLVSAGFAVLKEIRDGKALGNRLVESKRRSLSIRVVRERSEWQILLAGPDHAWISVIDWCKIVDRSGLFESSESLGVKVSLLADRLDAIQAIVDGPDFAAAAASLARLNPGRGRRRD